MLRKYRSSLDDSLKAMQEANEHPWDFSTTYVFGLTNKFYGRLSKVSNFIILFIDE